MNKMIDVVDKLMNMDGVPLGRLEVQATRRLQNDPRQAIRLARSGSYYDIYAIVNNGERGFPAIPPKLHDSLFEAFCVHVAKPKVFLDRAKDKTSQTSIIMFSLLGISLFESSFIQQSKRSANLLVKSWPDILRWLEFLYDEPLPNWPSKTGFPSGLIKIIHSIVEMISDCLEARTIFQGLELFRFAARVWLEDKRPRDESDESYAASILAMTCETVEDMKQRLDILMDISGDYDWDPAELAIYRLKIASRRALEEPDLAAAFNHIEVLYQLSRTKTHRLHRDIMAFRPIPLVLKCMLRYIAFSTPSQKDNVGILVVRGFDILLNIIDSSDRALVYTLEALRCGLLEAFVRAAPLMQDFDDEHNWASAYVLLKLMICQLSLASILGPTTRALQRLEARRIEQLPADCPREFKEQWTKYRDVAYERWVCKVIYNRRRICSNRKCEKVNHDGSFKRCVACESAFYCSRKCQREAWKTGGHPEECRTMRRTARKSELRQSDRDFLIDQAAAQVYRHMPGLKKIAARDIPGVPQSNIVFRVDYLSFPPVMTLRKHMFVEENQTLISGINSGGILWLEVRVPLGGNSYEQITHFNLARNLWEESPKDKLLRKRRLNFCDEYGNELDVRGDEVSEILCRLKERIKQGEQCCDEGQHCAERLTSMVLEAAKVYPCRAPSECHHS